MSVRQREVPREALTCLMWIEGLDEGQPKEGLGRVVDLSTKGAGVVTTDAVPVNTRVRVELLIPSTSVRLTATGTVVYSRPENQQVRLGLHFDSEPVLIDDLASRASREED